MAKQILFRDPISITNFEDHKLDDWIQINLDRCKEAKKTNFISNRGGFQTPNLLDDTITDLISPYILKSMKDFTDEKLHYQIDNIWINENYKFCYNKFHTHPHSHLSGVYYLKTPKNCGNLVFERHDANSFCDLPDIFKFNDEYSNCFHITPKKGQLVIFPSSMGHYVEANLSDEPRVSISFNFNIIK